MTFTEDLLLIWNRMAERTARPGLYRIFRNEEDTVTIEIFDTPTLTNELNNLEEKVRKLELRWDNLHGIGFGGNSISKIIYTTLPENSTESK